MIELPTLYSKTADGSINQWRVYSDAGYVFTEHGSLGGKQVQRKVKCKPTNVGRSNQRDENQQAQFEAQAAWAKKQDEGYFVSIEQAKVSEVLLPMLAQKLNKKHLRYPLSCQRKYNGLRAMAFVAEAGVRLISRANQEWDISHIAADVRRLGHPGDIFDGEIYVHGVPLQTLNSLVKNTKKAERLALRYHVYDMPRAEGKGDVWENRWVELGRRYDDYLRLYETQTSSTAGDPVVRLVETKTLTSEYEIQMFETQSILEGYEGLILRLHGDGYAFNARPKSLMKWKNFHDEEFVVVDMRSLDYEVNGKKATICDVCFCQNNQTDAVFKVKPRGSIEQMEEYWKHKDRYIGERLVVRFLERSVDGIPQGNPVGIAFRLPEDISIQDVSPWS
jgi:DNA ligase-1